MPSKGAGPALAPMRAIGGLEVSAPSRNAGPGAQTDPQAALDSSIGLSAFPGPDSDTYAAGESLRAVYAARSCHRHASRDGRCRSWPCGSSTASKQAVWGDSGSGRSAYGLLMTSPLDRSGNHDNHVDSSRVARQC